MRNFILIYFDDGLGEPKSINFSGNDPSSAFAIAEQERIGRHAELREGEKMLARLERVQSGGWRLSHP